MNKDILLLKEKIKKLEEENKKLSSLAFIDPLTKTYNRNWFNHNIHFNSKVFLVFVDLNNLKIINDSKGHSEGDRLILESAQFLKTFGNTVRFGGDEFIVICKNQDLFESLINMETPNFSKGGVSPAEYNNIAEAIEIADKRLYLDKKKNDIIN